VLFAGEVVEEGSGAVRARVAAARRGQARRNAEVVQRERGRRRRAITVTAARAGGGPPAAPLNADLEGLTLLAACDPTPAATRLLATAGERLRLSARAFHRVLRVARTIADLAGEDRVDEAVLAEALRMRGEAGL